jgi:hypothetical protein
MLSDNRDIIASSTSENFETDDASIIQKSTSLIKEQKEPFERDYYISFFYYKERKCEFKAFDTASLRKCLKKMISLARLSSQPASENKRQLDGVDQPILQKNDEYRKYFPAHNHDVELWHFKISDSGRVFFYFERLPSEKEPINICHVTYIVSSHPK